MEDLIALIPGAQYLDLVLTIALAAHGLALVIVNLTPTPADDQIVSYVYRVIEYVAGIIKTDTVKDKGNVDSAS